MDRPGKDTYRHREAGAHEVLVASGTRWALLHEVWGRSPGCPSCWPACSRSIWSWWRATRRIPSRSSRCTARRWASRRSGRSSPTSWRWLRTRRSATDRDAAAARPAGSLAELELRCLETQRNIAAVLERSARPGHIPPGWPVRPVDPTIVPVGAFLSCGALPCSASCLALPGCGYNTWCDTPFTYRQRTPTCRSGEARTCAASWDWQVEVEPLTPEPGDIWPGPLPPDADAAGPRARAANPADSAGAGLAADQGPTAARPCRHRPPPRGSSTPPGNRTSRACRRTASRRTPHRVHRPRRRPIAGPVGADAERAGRDHRAAPAATRPLTPGGGSAIVVPNGNGTSTIIHSDGRIETVPTPR